MSSVFKPSDSILPAFFNDSVVAYRGEIGEKQSDVLLSWSEELIKSRNWPLSQHKRAVRCTLELLQNVSKYTNLGSSESGFCQDEVYRMRTCNAVSVEERDHIIGAWDQSNQIELDSLRASRLDKLLVGERTQGGGAGLGFMDLRACSDDHVSVEFIPCSNEQFTFVLTVWIHPSVN